MTRHKLINYEAKIVRDELNETADLADHIHEQEVILIKKLYSLHQRRFYTRYGYNSLTGYCRFGLKFSKTQTQRIVTQVRRYEPTDNFGTKEQADDLQK